MSASKILVPIGFSSESIIALNQACNLAIIKKSKIFLITVIEEQSIIDSIFNNSENNIVEEKVHEKLSSIATEYMKKYNLEIETLVTKGKVYKKINELSETISADLIVMGTNGSPNGALRKFIGSNSERVVRLSKCPVITIKGKQHRDGCKNIILPLDLAKETKEKVKYALEYARYWDSTIRIISVFLGDDLEDKHKLTKNLDQVESFVKNANVKCTAELFRGTKKQSFGEIVLKNAVKYSGDLIMIMTKKEELSLSENISVTARYVINNSEIPVMSIRPIERDYNLGSTTAF